MHSQRQSTIMRWLGRLAARLNPPQQARPAAFAADETVPAGSPMPVREAGPESMRDPPSQWDAVDEFGDESFPASDPPPHSRSAMPD